MYSIVVGDDTSIVDGNKKIGCVIVEQLLQNENLVSKQLLVNDKEFIYDSSSNPVHYYRGRIKISWNDNAPHLTYLNGLVYFIEYSIKKTQNIDRLVDSIENEIRSIRLIHDRFIIQTLTVPTIYDENKGVRRLFIVDSNEYCTNILNGDKDLVLRRRLLKYIRDYSWVNLNINFDELPVDIQTLVLSVDDI